MCNKVPFFKGMAQTANAQMRQLSMILNAEPSMCIWICFSCLVFQALVASFERLRAGAM